MVLILFILPYSLTFHIVAFPLSCFETRFESTNLLIGHIFRVLSFHFIGSMFKYFKNTWNSFWICFVLTIRIQSSSCFVLWMWLFPCGSMESIAGLQKWSGEIKGSFSSAPPVFWGAENADSAIPRGSRYRFIPIWYSVN